MNMRNTHLKKQSKASRLLNEIAGNLDDVLTVGYQPVAVARYGLDGVYRMRSAREAAERRANLKRLEAKKLLSIKVEGHKYWAALTKDGIQEVIRQKVLDAELLPEDKSCVVVFDVPEIERGWRKALRNFLCQASFVCLQKSVWISPFNATAPLRQLFANVNAWRWVKVFTAENF